MKYCRNCGKQITDDSDFCPFCGEKQDNQTEIVNNEYQIYGQDGNKSTSKGSGLKLAAFVLALLTCISTGFFIIPLLWTVPMTISIYKNYKGEKELSTGFKVCTLIFLNTISGILLLIDQE